jgi:aerobic carbon-monoxide dehydrogenase large subunit
VVDDFGNLINPMLAEGQVHGGVVQGIGQAITERVVYRRRRPASVGELHGLRHAARRRRADDAFHAELVPSTANEIGMKGCGEAGRSARWPR